MNFPISLKRTRMSSRSRTTTENLKGGTVVPPFTYCGGCLSYSAVFLYNGICFTNNIFMGNLIVYGTSSLFFFGLLPVYVSVYTYADSKKKFASLNICIYRIFRLANINSAEGHIQINGKDAGINIVTAVKNAKTAFDNLCLIKVVQLADFGITNDAGAYASLAHHALTLALYNYISCGGGNCKLSGHVILNCEQDGIRHCAKAVCIINLVAATKILFMILSENADEN